MDWNRRAVESYWRSQLVNDVTTDEEKVDPAHKLEEICKYLRSSQAEIVKEVSDFISKRLDHKSPIVKQKALRLIKYLVGKLGVDFKREMQWSSATIRKLCDYKGQLDPLKGDALNKAVRDSASEAISAIFAAESNAPVLVENISKRIQGFGSKDFELQTGVKRSFLSQLVNLVSTSISLGESTIATSHSVRNNGNGSYKSQIEVDGSDRYDNEEQTLDVWGPSKVSRTVVDECWDQDSRATAADAMSGVSFSGHAREMSHEDKHSSANVADASNGVSISSHKREMSHEDKLLGTIVTSGGVRLQPTQDALQPFLLEASKLNAVALIHALESKLQSNLWQVRVKAMCVLESILRKPDNVHYSSVASFFMENKNTLLKCLKSPQASLREKTEIVLSHLDKKQTAETVGHSAKPSAAKAKTDAVVQILSSIGSGGLDDHGTEDSKQPQINPSTSPIVNDLFGDNLISGCPCANEEDPFADVSFHSTEDGEYDANPFSGLSIDDKKAGYLYARNRDGS